MLYDAKIRYRTREWMKIFTLQFEVAVRVRPTLETLTLILRPQSAIFSGGFFGALGLGFRALYLIPFLLLGLGLG